MIGLPWWDSAVAGPGSAIAMVVSGKSPLPDRGSSNTLTATAATVAATPTPAHRLDDAPLRGIIIPRLVSDVGVVRRGVRIARGGGTAGWVLMVPAVSAAAHAVETRLVASRRVAIALARMSVAGLRGAGMVVPTAVAALTGSPAAVTLGLRCVTGKASAEGCKRMSSAHC